MSTADGGIADFLKDLFTIAASIRVFVVVIKFPLPGPSIIITGSHLASMNHLLFPPGFLQLGSDGPHIYTKAHSCASLITFDNYYVLVQTRLKRPLHRKCQNNMTFVFFIIKQISI